MGENVITQAHGIKKEKETPKQKTWGGIVRNPGGTRLGRGRGLRVKSKDGVHCPERKRKGKTRGGERLNFYLISAPKRDRFSTGKSLTKVG